MPSAAPDIRLSPAVREALGADTARRITTASLDQARCAACRLPVPPHGPVTVVVSYDSTTAHVGFAHVGCSASQLRRLPEGALTQAAPAEPRMQISGLVHDCLGKRWPVLAAELTMQVLLAGPDPDRESRHLIVAALQQRGLERIAQPGALPRALPHWSATIRTAVDDTIDVQVRSGDGPIFFDGTATAFAADWFTVAARHRGCVLFAGAGLASAAGTVTTESLHDAARRGTLLAARILLR